MAAAVSLAVSAAGPGWGQTEAARARTAPLPTQVEIAALETSGPPPRVAPPNFQQRRAQYETEARDLALTLGAAHYLRWLCFGRREQVWRGFMTELLDREDQRFRAILAQAFNQGFDAERTRFDSCTPKAQESEAAWRAKGLRLADGLGARYRD